jgi:hypothetical protein
MEVLMMVMVMRKWEKMREASEQDQELRDLDSITLIQTLSKQLELLLATQALN